MITRQFFRNFLGDFCSIYTVLPSRLKRKSLAVLGAICVQGMLEVAAIVSISLMAVCITGPERLKQISVVVRIFELFPALGALGSEPRSFALLVSLGAVGVVAAKNAMFAIVTNKSAKLGEEISLFAGQTIFRKYLYSPYITHLSGESGTMFQAMSWRGELATLVTQFLLVYTYTGISIALIITLLWATPSMILLVLLLIGITSGGVYKSLKKGLDRAGFDVAESGRTEVQATMNAMNGIREALIYRQQQVFFDKFNDASMSGVKSRIFLRLAPSVPTWVLETAGFLAIPVTLWIMVTYQDASMTRIATVLMIIMLVAWRMLPLLNRALGAFVIVRSIRHAALQCLSFVEDALASPVAELPAPDPCFALRRSIAFDAVSFRYPNAQEDCLHDLSFTIPCGAKIGFIGRSGAGKSSIASILTGLVLPVRGEMLIDGKALTQAERAAYSRHIGYVPQTPYIMAGSLAENVAFSQWGKPWDEEKVIRACKMAEVDLIGEHGLEYQIGQGGAGLSGGQSQRLSIARALYADPSVLILDEATSALDSGVESAIINTIFNLPQNMTIIIIAHRLTTVERCDILFWIDNGMLVASGPPCSILAKYEGFLTRTSIRSDHKADTGI
jgi:ABC-type multidrug transport system fused ATPase/permease subunit